MEKRKQCMLLRWEHPKAEKPNNRYSTNGLCPYRKGWCENRIILFDLFRLFYQICSAQGTLRGGRYICKGFYIKSCWTIQKRRVSAAFSYSVLCAHQENTGFYWLTTAFRLHTFTTNEPPAVMYSGGRNHPLQSTSQKGIQDHYFGSGLFCTLKSCEFMRRKHSWKILKGSLRTMLP